MNREARGSSGGWKALAIFLAIVLVAAGILTGVFYALGDITFGQAEEQSEAKTETVAYAEDGSALESGATVPMQNMTFRTAQSLAENEAQAQQEYASVTLTGTLNPEGAVYTSAVWSADWADSASAWASGKAVSDYIAVTQTEENALQASVACLQPIGEQVVIKLTVTSENTLSEECTVDFAQRITSVSLKLGEVLCDFHYGVTRVPLQVSESGTAEGGAAELSYTTSEVYTVADSFTATYALSDWERFGIRNSPAGNTDWFAFCDFRNGTYDYSTIENYSVAENGMYFGLKFFVDNLGLHEFGATRSAPTVDDLYDDAGDAESYEQTLTYALQNYTDGTYNYYGVHLFSLTVTLTGAYSVYTDTTAIYIGSIVNTSVISDVTLDEDGIVF